MKTTLLNFVKIFSACALVISFFLLTAAGTYEHDLIMSHVLGQKSVTNAFGAFGTTLAALGIAACFTIIAHGMYGIIRESKIMSSQWSLGIVIGMASLLVVIYSLAALVNSVGFIKEAYDCKIYGADTAIACFSNAYNYLTLVIFSAVVLLIVSIRANKARRKTALIFC